MGHAFIGREALLAIIRERVAVLPRDELEAVLVAVLSGSNKSVTQLFAIADALGPPDGPCVCPRPPTQVSLPSGWRLIRDAWLNSRDVSAEAREYDAERSLPEAYERRVENADDLADTMRNEADRVALAANNEHAREEALAQIEELEAHAESLDRERQVLLAEWTGVWAEAKIDPRTPDEMLAWLAALDDIRRQCREEHRIVVIVIDRPTRQAFALFELRRARQRRNQSCQSLELRRGQGLGALNHRAPISSRPGRADCLHQFDRPAKLEARELSDIKQPFAVAQLVLAAHGKIGEKHVGDLRGAALHDFPPVSV